MARTITITLGDLRFEVPRLNIGQIEEIEEKARAGGKLFDSLRIAMKRAIPPCADFDSIEASPEQLREAIKAITELSGLQAEEKPTGED